MSTHDLSALQIHRNEDDPSRPRPGRRALIYIVCLVALAALGWIAWRTNWLPRGVPEVRVSRPRVIQAGGVEELLTATGYIVPQRKAVVSARISGRLEWRGVDLGSHVKTGEVIARLSNDDLAAQVAESKAVLAQGRAALEQARSLVWQTEREVERQRSLLSQGITTQSDYDNAKRAHDVAVSGVSAAEETVKAFQARISLNEANYDKTIIRAPFDGVVIAKSAEVGEMVAAGAFSGQPTGGAIVTVADFASLEMEADVNEGNVSKVANGQPALITVDAVPGRRYRGLLRQLVPTADRQKAIVMAKVTILDPDDRLVPDMSARVAFLSKEISAESAAAPPRIFVPSSIIRLAGNDPYVLTVKDEKVARIRVTLGESRGDLREVTTGLTGQEALIVFDGADGSEAAGLKEGDRVRVAS